MGRLTLNVLLSFAQFEREVIGERVRDKIAASKRKGLWVGGPVPLGYRCLDKKLEIVPEEAETVRTIFSLYLELGSMGALTPNSGREGLSGQGSQSCILVVGSVDANSRLDCCAIDHAHVVLRD
jgi:site-specific DNA recombinase